MLIIGIKDEKQNNNQNISFSNSILSFVCLFYFPKSKGLQAQIFQTVYDGFTTFIFSLFMHASHYTHGPSHHTAWTVDSF